MDTNKPAADADNHNTNQNEAVCANRCIPVMDQFQEPNFLSRETSPSNNFEVNVKSDSSKSVPIIPTIIVTPASPDLGGTASALEQCCEGSHLLGLSNESQADDSSLLDVSLLCPPPTDTRAITRRPPSHDPEASSMDTLNISRQQTSCPETSQEDTQVMRRFSSTPVMGEASRAQNLDNKDCSVISLSDASPIAPDESAVATPNLSTNRYKSHEEGSSEDSACTSSPNSNIMYVHPQYLVHNQGQTTVRRDAPVSQNGQSSYMAGRVIDPSYLATASVSAGAYSGSHNVYQAYLDGGGCYNDYMPARDSSWTDLSYRSDTSPVPPVGGPALDICCYPPPAVSTSGSEHFVYPSIYVSSSGLISVLLRNDMSVEMTVDRTIRVVSHNHMMAVATDSRGTAACLYHPAVKVFQIGTTTDIATLNFRARMGGDVIVFSNGVSFFKLEDSELQPTAPIKFTDIFRDQSVNLLFSSEGYGESLVASCMQVAAQAEYANLPKGGVIVRINGVKVTQTGGGDVTVVTGAKFIRLSPHFGSTRLGNRFVDIEVDKDWTVRLTRGSHSFVYSKKRAMVCNGKMEAGFDETNGLKVTNLQLRLPLLSEPSMIRRPCRKQVRVPPVAGTPKRRPGPTGTGRGSGMT